MNFSKQKNKAGAFLVVLLLSLIVPILKPAAANAVKFDQVHVSSGQFDYTYTDSGSPTELGSITGKENSLGRQINPNPISNITLKPGALAYGGKVAEQCRSAFSDNYYCFVGNAVDANNQKIDNAWLIWRFKADNPSGDQIIVFVVFDEGSNSFQYTEEADSNWGGYATSGVTPPAISNYEVLKKKILANQAGVQLNNLDVTGKIVFNNIPKSPDLLSKSEVILANDKGGHYTGTLAAGTDDSTYNFKIHIDSLNYKLLDKYIFYLQSNDKGVACVGVNAGSQKDGNWSSIGGGLTELFSPNNSCTVYYSAYLSFQINSTHKISNIDQTDSVSQSNSLLDLTATSVTSPVTLQGNETFNSPLDQAISNAIKWIAGGVSSSMNWVMTEIDNLLNSTEDLVIGKAGTVAALNAPWVVVKNLALSLLVMALIIIAFANVMQVDIEQYGLNRMIPKIIISIILAMASWIIVIFFFDMSAAIQAQAAGLTKSINIIAGLESMTITTPSSGAIIANLGVLITIIIILIGILACGIVLLFLLLIRIVFLSFLLVVAPLAFIFNILPFTQGLTKQWWSEFFKWMFMGPIAVAIIAIGELIAAAAAGGAITAGAVTVGTDALAREGVMIGLVIFGASLYMAATLPLSWGGKIMSSWGGIGKNIWGKTKGAAGGLAGLGWRATGVPGASDKIGGSVSDWFSRGREKRENMLARGASFGKVGTSAGVIERRQMDAKIATVTEQNGYDKLGQPELINEYKSAKNPYQKQAIERQMAAKGDLEKLFAAEGTIDEAGNWLEGTEKEQDAARAAAGARLVELGGKDQALEASVFDKQAELLVAAGRTGTTYGRGLQSRGYASQKSKAMYDKRANVLDEIRAQFNDESMRDQLYANGSDASGGLTKYGKDLLAYTSVKDEETLDSSQKITNKTRSKGVKYLDDDNIRSARAAIGVANSDKRIR